MNWKAAALLILALLGVETLSAQATTRSVDLSWTLSTSTGIVSQTVQRGTSSSGPFTVLSSSLSPTTTTYVDTTAVIGTTYTYQVIAVAAACTSTTSLTTPCGSSPPASATTNVPPQPAVTVTVTVTVP